MNHPSERWLKSTTWENNYFFNSIAAFQTPIMEKLQEILITELRSLEWNSLLEVGCAYGCVLFDIRDAFPEKKIYGVDFSEWAIRKANDIQKKQKRETIDYSVMDAKHLFFMDDFADIILCANLLSSVSTDDKFEIFGEMYRVAKKYIIIRDFNPDYASNKDLQYCAKHPQIDIDMTVNELIPYFEFKHIIMVPLPRTNEVRHLNCLWICEL